MKITADDIRNSTRTRLNLGKMCTDLSEFFDVFLVPLMLKENDYGCKDLTIKKDYLASLLENFNESIYELTLFLEYRGFSVVESNGYVSISWEEN